MTIQRRSISVTTIHQVKVSVGYNPDAGNAGNNTNYYGGDQQHQVSAYNNDYSNYGQAETSSNPYQTDYSQADTNNAVIVNNKHINSIVRRILRWQRLLWLSAATTVTISIVSY